MFYILGIFIYYAIKLPFIGSVVKRVASGIVSGAGLRGLTREAEMLSFYEGSQLHFKEVILIMMTVEYIFQARIPSGLM